MTVHALNRRQLDRLSRRPRMPPGDEPVAI
jgi:hypothetical protein